MSLDKDIRVAVKALILEVDANAKIYAFDTLPLDPSEWANLFIKAGQLHGWVIKRSGMTSREVRGGVFKDTYMYDVWGFYGFSGKSETDNSDDLFQEILDEVCEKLKAEMKLGLDCVSEHKLLQIPNIVVMRSGDTAMHFAAGKLEVELCARAAGATC
jgi:hypothetical protein